MAKLLLCLLLPIRSIAHNGAHSGELSPTSFNTEPHVWIGLFTILALYLFGINKKNGSKLTKTFFWTGWSSLFLALLTAIDLYSEKMASIHMLQHTLILMVAAPCLAIAGLDYHIMVSTSFLNKTLIKKLYVKTVKLLRKQRALTAFGLYAATLYIWHVPKFYNAALSDGHLHDLQHILFFATAYLFWRVVFNPYGAKLLPTVATAYLFVSMIHAMILGALMGLSQGVWYQPYIESSKLLGINPLRDQQTAGLIMWMPAGITFILSSLWSVKRILGYSSRLIK
ncbi:MAG: hypothetical protein CME64_13095 [Halobacteriovoraceae bacterium]|nr:hypothetical protein [Halobacteriovoraceae bacterium]|tara:strand:+ start:74837 stop:75685 length:849 start_codon:yes stop_codon:yes gene_type:complete